MAKRAAPIAPPAPRFYLATPELAETGDFQRQIADLLDTADIAAVLLRIAADADAGAVVAALAPTVQKAGAALLLDGHADIAARSAADGVHVSDAGALKATLAAFKPDRIVGIGHLPSRHDAMIAGETGADYVLFGEIDETGTRPSTEAIAERVAWWAELFEPPCVVYAASVEEVRAFAQAGADFIMVDFVWNDPRGARAAMMDAAEAIRRN